MSSSDESDYQENQGKPKKKSIRNSKKDTSLLQKSYVIK